MDRRSKWSRNCRRAQPTFATLLFVTLASISGCRDAEPAPPVPLEERTPKVLLIGITIDPSWGLDVRSVGLR